MKVGLGFNLILRLIDLLKQKWTKWEYKHLQEQLIICILSERWCTL